MAGRFDQSGVGIGAGGGSGVGMGFRPRVIRFELCIALGFVRSASSLETLTDRFHESGVGVWY